MENEVLTTLFRLVSDNETPIDELLRLYGAESKETYNVGEKEFDLSKVLQSLKVFDKAVEFLEKSIELNNDYHKVNNLISLSYMYFVLKRFKKTIYYGKKIIEIDVGCSFGWANCGAGYEKLGKFYCSLYHYENAVRIVVEKNKLSTWDFINGRAYCHSKLGNYIESFGDYALASKYELLSSNEEFTNFHRQSVGELPLSRVMSSLEKKLWGIDQETISGMIGTENYSQSTFESYFSKHAVKKKEDEEDSSRKYLPDDNNKSLLVELCKFGSGSRSSMGWFWERIFRSRILVLAKKETSAFIDVRIIVVTS